MQYPVEMLDEIGWAIVNTTPHGSYKQARAVMAVVETYIAMRDVEARHPGLAQPASHWGRSTLRAMEGGQ